MHRIIIATIVSTLSSCNSIGKHSSNSDTSADPCARVWAHSLSTSYDLGDLGTVECVAVKYIKSSTMPTVQISLDSPNDEMWPRIFLVWLGTSAPQINVRYPKDPSSMPGYYGFSQTMSSSNYPFAKDSEVIFSQIGSSSGDITSGAITLTGAKKSTTINFSAPTTVEQK